MNVRRAALVAAVLLSLLRADFILTQFRGLFANFEWLHVPNTIVCILNPLPLPVLLVVLWRSDAALSLSKGLRRVALGTAIGYAALFPIPNAYRWLWWLPRDWPDVTWSQGGAAFHQLLDWAGTLSLSPMLWGALNWVSETAFVVFMIALFRHRDEAGARQSRLLREAAALATLVAGLVLVASAVYYPIAVSKYPAEPWSPPKGQILLSVATSAFRDLCWFLAPLLVYRMQPPARLGASRELEPAFQRHPAEAPARRGEDGVGDGRGDADDGGFSGTG